MDDKIWEISSKVAKICDADVTVKVAKEANELKTVKEKVDVEVKVKVE